MNKVLIGVIVLIAIGLGAWWYLNQNNSPASSTDIAEQLKKDISLLQGTTVTVNKNDGDFYIFSSSDGNSSVVGIAKLQVNGRFKLLWTGQEAPDCSTFPQEIPVTLMESCYDGNTLKPR